VEHDRIEASAHDLLGAAETACITNLGERGRCPPDGVMNEIPRADRILTVEPEFLVLRGLKAAA
jgi:hypothetical protein